MNKMHIWTIGIMKVSRSYWGNCSITVVLGYCWGSLKPNNRLIPEFNNRIKSYLPMIGESPTLPTILFRIPPVEVAHATLPEQSTATAPTVSWFLKWESHILLIMEYKFQLYCAKTHQPVNRHFWANLQISCPTTFKHTLQDVKL